MNKKKQILKRIRKGIRLKTKRPQIFIDKSKYNRKKKHKKKYKID